MTRDEKITELLKVAAPKEKVRLGLLNNGSVKCAKAYQEGSKASTLTDWNRAEETLDRYVARLWPIYFGDPDGAGRLAALADVMEHLAGEYVISKSSIHRHHREGKIRPGPDGSYSVAAAEKYASTWLRRKATGRKERDDIEDLQHRKAELEVRNLEIDNKRKALALAREETNYITMDQLSIELATRAGILDAGIRTVVQANAPEWIRACHGDLGTIAAFIAHVIADLGGLLQEMASPTEFQVVIGGPPAASITFNDLDEC